MIVMVVAVLNMMTMVMRILVCGEVTNVPCYSHSDSHLV
jgi:hypothetical protein